MGCSQEAPDPGNKARRTVPPTESGSSSRQRGLPGTVGPPHRPRPAGGPMAGGRRWLTVGLIPTSNRLRVAGSLEGGWP